MLADDEIERFTADGFVLVRRAVPPPVLEECQAQLDLDLRQAGVDPDDATTWAEPVVRFPCPNTPPFVSAGTQPVLWRFYDQLLGPGRYVERRGVGGSVPLRFPGDTDPGDAGWHIDSSFPIGGTWGVNFRSKGRGLLCLFLFSDVGLDDAPTEIKVGSHLHVPATLESMGEAGGFYDVKQSDAFAAIAQLPSAFATGQAGDVYVCHPFLQHRATWPHRGTRPRFIAQPEIGTHEPFQLTEAGEVVPVERAILDGLTRAGPRPDHVRQALISAPQSARLTRTYCARCNAPNCGRRPSSVTTRRASTPRTLMAPSAVAFPERLSRAGTPVTGGSGKRFRSVVIDRSAVLPRDACATCQR